MEQLEQKRKILQETMNFASGLAYGVEKLAGRGALGMSFAAGRKLGKKFSDQSKKTENIEDALDEVRNVLKDNHFLWQFEPFKQKHQGELVTVEEDGSQSMKLIFRDCMIRQALFCYGHDQKGSLCSMMYGFFSGALENIMGKQSKLEIIHAGQNACLKNLKISP